MPCLLLPGDSSDAFTATPLQVRTNQRGHESRLRECACSYCYGRGSGESCYCHQHDSAVVPLPFVATLSKDQCRRGSTGGIFFVKPSHAWSDSDPLTYFQLPCRYSSAGDTPRDEWNALLNEDVTGNPVHEHPLRAIIIDELDQIYGDHEPNNWRRSGDPQNNG